MSESSPVNGIWFPQWPAVLAGVPLPELERAAYRRALVGYLQFCGKSRQRATLASARQFMQQVEAQRRLGRSQLATWKSALNWFFKAGTQPLPKTLNAPVAVDRPARRDDKVPPLAATDLGATEWERRLIRELRTRHYQWRTEQAYRMWAGRFARWLEAQRRDGGVFKAGEAELRDFLSELATRQRVAVATQRQALNALVFLVREALGKPLADFSQFTRARVIRRVPAVLSRPECQRLLGALEGTTRLMAELMYGSGLRLMELLRLRVHPVR